MADATIESVVMLQVTPDIQVRSEVTFDASQEHRTVVWITSSYDSEAGAQSTGGERTLATVTYDPSSGRMSTKLASPQGLESGGSVGRKTISARNSITVRHRADYSPEQLAYDVDQARWRFASALVGKAAVRGVLASALTPPAITPPLHNGPQVARPSTPATPKPPTID